jgi:hypothetical protein
MEVVLPYYIQKSSNNIQLFKLGCYHPYITPFHQVGLFCKLLHQCRLAPKNDEMHDGENKNEITLFIGQKIYGEVNTLAINILP